MGYGNISLAAPDIVDDTGVIETGIDTRELVLIVICYDIYCFINAFILSSAGNFTAVPGRSVCGVILCSCSTLQQPTSRPFYRIARGKVV